MASDCKLQRARIRSHSSLHITSHCDTFHIQTLGVIAINMVSKQRGGMLSGRDNRTKIRQFSIISTLLYRLLYKYIHISFIFNKILSSLYPFAFTLNLLEWVVYTQYLYFLISHILLKPHHLSLPSPFYPASWPLEIVPSLTDFYRTKQVSWGVVKFLEGFEKINKVKGSWEPFCSILLWQQGQLADTANCLWEWCDANDLGKLFCINEEEEVHLLHS